MLSSSGSVGNILRTNALLRNRVFLTRYTRSSFQVSQTNKSSYPYYPFISKPSTLSALWFVVLNDAAPDSSTTAKKVFEITLSEASWSLMSDGANNQVEQQLLLQMKKKM
jgi:hypothetical protein